MTQKKTDPEMSLRDLVDVVRRRRRLLLGALFAAMMTALLIAFLLPAKYRSIGTILIEQQEIPQDLVRSTVTSYADERVQVISQRVMTTQNLLEIMKRYDLYASERRRESRERLMERMRDDIEFKMLSAGVIDPRSGLPRQATIAFTVSYDSYAPDLAVKVANELISLYLNENLTTRARLAEDTSAFLKEEAERMSARIAELEAALARFKGENVAQLPEFSQLNMQLLDRTQQQMRETQSELRALEQQRVFLEAQLAQLKPNSVLYSDSGERILSTTDRLKSLRSELASRSALYSPEHPDIERIQREIEGLSTEADAVPVTNDLLRRLETARADLAQARERYSAEHPDVLRHAREVKALEDALAQELAQPVSGTPVSADNPAYIQIQAQLAATVANQRALGTRLDEARAQLAAYQRKLNVAPAVEQEFRELTRDYDNAQLRYREVRAKQMEAQLAQNLETDRKGERFTLIEPPLPPEEPVSPNRLAILIVGLIMSLALAAGSVAIAEALDRTIRGRNDVIDSTQMPPIVLVPRIVTAREARTARLRFRVAAAATATSVVVGLLIVHLLVRPLDIVWYTTLRKFGL